MTIEKQVKQMPTSPNDRQVGGDHYHSPIQHWDFVLANNIPYLEAQIIKYVFRWRKKGGLQDLEKAKHFLDKLIDEADIIRNVEVAQKVGASRIKPTGYEGFTFEAAKEGRFHYTCKNCGTQVRCGADVDPFQYHGECAGKTYAAQT